MTINICTRILGCCLYIFFFIFPSWESLAADHHFPYVQDTSSLLTPSPVYSEEAFVISYVLSKRHYKKIPFNDSLSSIMLDLYIESLDPNKHYFMSDDIASFEKYRYVIDDKIKDKNVTLAYLIYHVYLNRYMGRMKKAKLLIDKPFDYTKDEYYDMNREDDTWCKSVKEYDDLWRRMVKSQMLSLKLTGKVEESIEEQLHKRYNGFIKRIKQFNSEDVFNLYMNALTQSYDPHTNYLSPKASSLFKQSMSLSLEGIGATLRTENDYTKVVSIVPGGPANKSDLLHPNDLIIGVAQGKEGEMVDVLGWRIDEVVKLIKGPRGTRVRLQILPEETGISGPVKEIQMIREKIKLEDMAAKKRVIDYHAEGKDYKFGIINIPSFYMDYEAYKKGDPYYRSTTADVKKLIILLKEDNVDGIVIDLRGNGGGALSEAISLTGLFIEEGPVVQVKNFFDKIEVGLDDDKKILYDGPLVVTTNRFSASASEIFAGAIQDYNRGLIVGEPTYGKGTVQTVVPLDRFIQGKDPVGELKYTIQKFYRVTGSSTQKKGVIPDVALPSAFEESQFREEENKSALRWDVIAPTSYDKTYDVNSETIAWMNEYYTNRTFRDEGLRKYIQRTEKAKQSMKNVEVSLNEDQRRKEMKDNVNEENDVENEASAKSVESMENGFLRESLIMLSQLVTKKAD